MKTLCKMLAVLPLPIILFAAAATLFGQGFFFSNIGVNGGARAPVYSPDSVYPSLQSWGNTLDASPPGSQSYSGSLVAGTDYSVEAWYTLNLVTDRFQLLQQGRPVNGSLSAFRLTAAPGFFSAGSVTIPDANLSTDGFYANLQVRAWDNANGQLASWDAAWTAAQSGSGRQVGWSAVFYQPLETRLIPWPGLINFESFNLFVVPEPSVFSLLSLGGAIVVVMRRRRQHTARLSNDGVLKR